MLSRLGFLQIASLVIFGASIVVGALLYRHFSDEVFTPVLDFSRSLNIAFPPGAVFLFTIAVAVLRGISPIEVANRTLGWLRNVYFQSVRMMFVAIAVMSIGISSALIAMSIVVPPAYVNLVENLLGGEADDYKRVQSVLASIEKKNPLYASQLTSAVRVFSERHKLTTTGASATSAGTARILVRTLEEDFDAQWSADPIRLHSLAEAYSLYSDSAGAQPVLSSLSGLDGGTIGEKAISAYQRVIDSSDRRVIPLLRASALLNQGNLYYRKGQENVALVKWREANDPAKGWRNTAASGNIVAALIRLNRIDEAISEGMASKEWAERTGLALRETNQYAGIVAQIGFARMIQSDFDAAVRDNALVALLLDDSLAWMNLALALGLQGDTENAKRAITRVAADVTPMTQLVAAKGIVAPECAYLIWDLIDPEADFAKSAGRLTSYLMLNVMPQEITAASKSEVEKLRSMALAKLRQGRNDCSDLDLIPAVVQRLGGGTKVAD